MTPRRAGAALGGAVLACAVAWACSSKQPPVVGDTDGGRADVYSRVEGGFATESDASIDAAPNGAVAITNDYESKCPSAASPLWSYHDFQTKTPKDSAIVFVAQTAATKAGLDAAPPVQLAKVTGPDITAWTGVDVDTKLIAAGQKSLAFLRVTTTLVPASDATAPTLVAARQQYDCVQNM